MRTTQITLDSIKESDGWLGLANDLGFTNEEAEQIFEYGEVGKITIKVDENLNIIGGKIHRIGKNKII